MSKKRFTDINIWDREWYMELSPKHKCLIKYIFDKCDASGCWKPNWKLASVHINENVCNDDLKLIPDDQYEYLDNGKIYLPDFINFQYGTLSEKSPAHNPVFRAVEKNNLQDRVFNRVQSTPKEEDKDKEEEEEEDKGGTGGIKPKEMKGKMPVSSDYGKLPDIKNSSAIEFVRILKQVTITVKDVDDIWEVFKVQNLNGKKFYNDDSEVYGHFLNWIKTQNFNKIEKNGTKSNSSSNGKLGTSAARMQGVKDF